MNNTALFFIGMIAWTTACQGEAVYADPDSNENEGDGPGFAAAATVDGNVTAMNNAATSVTTTGAATTGHTATGVTTTGGTDGSGGAVGDAVSASGAMLPGNPSEDADLDPGCAPQVEACWNDLPNELFTDEKCRAMQYACRGLKEVCKTQFLFDAQAPSDEELCDAAAGSYERTRHSYGLDVTGTHITCCWLEPL